MCYLLYAVDTGHPAKPVDTGHPPRIIAGIATLTRQGFDRKPLSFCGFYENTSGNIETLGLAALFNPYQPTRVSTT